MVLPINLIFFEFQEKNTTIQNSQVILKNIAIHYNEILYKIIKNLLENGIKDENPI